MLPTPDEDYFAVFGLDRRMNIESAELEERFYDLSRRLHPDNFYRASAEKRAVSLDRSARLNDAYRTLRDPFTRAAYLLSLEGRELQKQGPGVPPELLEEVFELNEQMEEFRAAALDPAQTARRAEVQQQLTQTKADLQNRLETCLVELQALFVRWDQGTASGRPPVERTAVIDGLSKILAKRKYLQNLVDEVSNALGGLAR